MSRKVYLTEPVLINGEAVDAGKVVEVDDADALNIIGAGRGTLDIPTKKPKAES